MVYEHDKIMMHNGFRAEVLDERRFAFYLDSKHVRTHKTIETLPETLTKKFIDELKAQALAEGYDTIHVRLDRYIRYSLRTVMTNRSGWLNKSTIYKHVDGVWTKKIEVDSRGIY
jgi:hypothetical protein